MATLPRLDLTAGVRPAEAHGKERELLARLAGLGRTLVAFSAGVDSAYLAWAAARVLGGDALAVTALSDSVPLASREEAPRLAARIGIAHEWMATRETEDPRYRANRPDRCYWCKSELYDRLKEMATERGFAAVVDGCNLDDVGDWRPGRRAAGERGVRSPLLEAGLGKAEIRWLSRRAGLPTWHRPASPCLSSRVPYGRPIDAGVLAAIDRAEAAVRALGLREFRVRHLGERARVEVAAEELERTLEPELRRRLEAAVAAAGFAAVEVDPEPFRSGRLNEQVGLRGPGPRPAGRDGTGGEDDANGQVHRV